MIRRLAVVLALVASITVPSMLVGTPIADATGATSQYVPLSPSRILDTRNATQGDFSTPWGPGQARTVQVGGRGGVPASGVEAVALHVTTVGPTAPGTFLTVWPTGGVQPTAASINVGTNSAHTSLSNNLLISKVNAAGQLDIYNNLGSVHLVIDVAGYYTTSGGADFVALPPARVLDTRNSTEGDFSTPWGPGQSRTVQIGGRGGVPASGVDAVALHVTSVAPTAEGTFLTVWPTGESQPVAASMNVGTNAVHTALVNDLLVSKVNGSGQINVYNNLGTVHLVIDVVGYYTSTGTGSEFVSLSPDRILDTRNSSQGAYNTPWGQTEIRGVQATGQGGVPGNDVDAVLVHVTTVSPTAPGTYLTAYPPNVPQPVAASMNVGTNADHTALVNDLLIAKVDESGQFNIYNNLGSVDVVIDVVGYFVTTTTCSLPGGVVATTQVPQSECDALVEVYNSTNGGSWTTDTGWLTATDPCSWHGVSCAASQITTLNLESINLTGSLPAEIGDFASLENLVIYDNPGLTGSIPADVGNLATLKNLNLSSNGLTGSIPTEVGNLANLTQLSLHSNSLTGSIPTSLDNLSNLEDLWLFNNQLSGSIPTELGNLSNLQLLHLHNNLLTGSIPTSLGNLSELWYLRLTNNQLSGSIPTQLGNLSNLKFLRLDENALTGGIPTELGNIAGLQELLLGDNGLTGGVPASLANLHSLQRLTLHTNSLAGNLDTPIGGLTDTLTEIDLAPNGCFTATAPAVVNFLNANDPDWASGC